MYILDSLTVITHTDVRVSLSAVALLSSRLLSHSSNPHLYCGFGSTIRLFSVLFFCFVFFCIKLYFCIKCQCKSSVVYALVFRSVIVAIWCPHYCLQTTWCNLTPQLMMKAQSYCDLVSSCNDYCVLQHQHLLSGFVYT